jgi:hypothetical protein
MTKDFEIIEIGVDDGVVDPHFGIKDCLLPNLML